VDSNLAVFLLVRFSRNSQQLGRSAWLRFTHAGFQAYLALVLALAVLFAWPTVHRWHFQHFLSEKATELADNHRAKVHCNTLFDTMLDSEMLAAGHANPRTGEIGIQKPWCGTLMSYPPLTRAVPLSWKSRAWIYLLMRACTSEAR